MPLGKGWRSLTTWHRRPSSEVATTLVTMSGPRVLTASSLQDSRHNRNCKGRFTPRTTRGVSINLARWRLRQTPGAAREVGRDRLSDGPNAVIESSPTVVGERG